MNPPIFRTNILTDAAGWPDGITVTLSLNSDQTVPDPLGEPGDGTPNPDTIHIVSTGTASWTLSRASLGDYVAHPALPLVDDAGLGNGVPGQPVVSRVMLAQGEFLPVQSAIGKMPGWIVWFGAMPDPVKDAITVTTTYSNTDNHPDSPVIGHADAYCPPLSMTCAEVAPGRRIMLGDPSYGAGAYTGPSLLGMNRGYPNEGVTDDGGQVSTNIITGTYTLVLTQPGIPATATAPEVLPVYRITLPDDVFYCGLTVNPGDGSVYPVLYLSIGYNGAAPTYPTDYDDYVINDYSIGNVGQGYFDGFASLGPSDDPTRTARVYQRTRTMADIELPVVTDTLTAGIIRYQARADPLPSTVSFGSSTAPISTISPMAGQSFTAPADDGGYTYGAQF